MTRFPTAAVAAALLVLLATVGGCFRDADIVDVDDTTPTVFSLLTAGADSASVLVVRPRDGAGPQPLTYEPVHGAEVRLIRDGDTVWAVEGERPCIGEWTGSGEAGGCYWAALGEPIAPGEEYRLEIQLPTGGAVTGETVVPGPPVILEPEVGQVVEATCDQADTCYGRHVPEAEPAFIPVASVPMIWELPSGIQRVVPSLEATTTYYQDQVYPDGCRLGRVAVYGVEAESGATRDSLRWPILNIDCPDPALHPGRFDSIRAEVSVTTVGPAYSSYLETVLEATVREPRASHGLTGAYGVFSAVTPARRSILLVRGEGVGSIIDNR